MERTSNPRAVTVNRYPPAAGDGDSPPQAAAAGRLQRLPATLEPDPSLLRYYALAALLFGPGFFIAIIPFYFRYRTLRYEVDDEGITMRWGILFRREISLTYARIQDIHLTSNVVERWLGLARIQVQTASGSASAEMTIEGLRNVDAMRDFLYARMRGARDQGGHAAGKPAVRSGAGAAAPSADRADAPALVELADTLNTVADEIRALGHELAGRRAPDAARREDGHA
jgi:membrane protein YdbS with pleckstrin-like domain